MTLTYQALIDTLAHIPKEPRVVGAVVRRDRLAQIAELCPDAFEPGPAGFPIYYDDQEEEVLMFEDDELLRVYLNRRAEPRAYYEYVARIVGAPFKYVETLTGHGVVSLTTLTTMLQLLKNSDGRMQESINSILEHYAK